MTATVEDGWAVQVSIKHGPRDERGNPSFMTNVRGADSATVAQHLAELSAFGAQIHQGVNHFIAVENLSANFTISPVAASAASPVAQAVTNASVPMHSPQGSPTSTVCPVNNRALHNVRTGEKNGKAWKGIFCNNIPECAKQWIND